MPIPAIVGAAAIGAGAAGGQSILNAHQSKKNVQRTIRHQKEMAQYAYSQDLQQWNRENAYNDPSAQIGRLEGAGLNKNLMYGNGTASAGNTSNTSPKYQAPQLKYDVEAPQVTGILREFQDMKLRQAQIDNVKANTEQTESNTNLLYAKNIVQTAIGRKQNLELGLRPANVPTGLRYEKQLDEDLQIRQSERRILDQKLKQAVADTELKNFQVALSKQGLTLSDDVSARLTLLIMKRKGLASKFPDVYLASQIASSIAKLGIGAAMTKSLGKKAPTNITNYNRTFKGRTQRVRSRKN